MPTHSPSSNTSPRRYCSCIKKPANSIGISTPLHKRLQILISNILHCSRV